MKAARPVKLNKQRALTDIVYYAENYLDLKLTAVQKALLKQLGEGKVLIGGGRRHGLTTISNTAKAHKKFKEGNK